MVGFHFFGIFISFFDEVSNFPKQKVNQSETGIDDKKLSADLYVPVKISMKNYPLELSRLENHQQDVVI